MRYRLEDITDSILAEQFGKTPEQAQTIELYHAVSKAVVSIINENWAKSREKDTKRKRAFYFSAEFLVGRAIFNNLYCTGLLPEAKEYFTKHHLDLRIFEDIEDAALGNGGLGRLAACFLDSAATHGIPLDGYGIRYRFGLFRQKIENGFQKETADDWQRCGDPFSIPHREDTLTVAFADQTVQAVPYDLPVIGYNGETVNTLRLWQSEAMEEFDLDAFNRQDYGKAFEARNKAEMVCAVLYPNDDTDSGKILRIKQEYFFASASVQDIIRRYKKTHDHFDSFANDTAIQLNDTHPVVAIPELLRILVSQENLDFSTALEIAKKTFAYTNHTVMPEALEKWNVRLFRSVLPEIYEWILRIDGALEAELNAKGMVTGDLEPFRIIDNGQIHMARLAIFATHSTNGVAAIHTGILKEKVLREWADLYPERFSNKTNGITQRRWLGLNNPELSSFIAERIGKGFLTDLSELEKLEKYRTDEDSLEELRRIKRCKKEQLAGHIFEKEGIRLDPGFIFDVQVKRFHEYKRQLLNAFSILYIYNGIKEGRIQDFYPTVFLFGGKAAPGYFRAKGIIKYIHEIAGMINRDPDVSDRMAVVFATDYNVSYAEKIVAAADLSEQISTAGTEASGTSNMKFMLNGAVTLGTYDGANVEIVGQAGMENNYIFGYHVEDIDAIRGTYDPAAICHADPDIKKVVDSLVDGTFSDDGTHMFEELHRSLFQKFSYHDPDQYYLLGDFLSYCETRLRANRDYSDKKLFPMKCFANIIHSGEFSSDRAVRQYADEIWDVLPEN